MKLWPLLAVAATLVAACGEDVQAPDLFLITRTGQGSKLTLLVNGGGTISCNGAKAKMISSGELIKARDLADDLSTDAQNKLRLAPTRASVYSYTIRMQQGTLSFADTAARNHKELAEAELFTVQAATSVCGLSG